MKIYKTRIYVHFYENSDSFISNRTDGPAEINTDGAQAWVSQGYFKQIFSNGNVNINIRCIDK